ncbi:hypothetical protein [Sphingopyxis sp.]|uniref:hypothetical protein n=1 Tax=Sphingopyxis sp. TaxID=1908224 RepID=UPI0025E1733C|nr:hypothetical protein [Sphingopyxis sp.]MBK6414040.1 hypothetical protein [Sphingopyxis sp.]
MSTEFTSSRPRIAAVAAVFFPSRPDDGVHEQVADALTFRSPGQRLCCNGLQLALLPCSQPGWFLIAAGSRQKPTERSSTC